MMNPNKIKTYSIYNNNFTIKNIVDRNKKMKHYFYYSNLDGMTRYIKDYYL